MTIERGTTQELYITIKGFDLTDCDIYITFQQGPVTLTKKTMTSVTYTNNITRILLTLSQQETLMFQENKSGKLQARWVEPDGSTYKTATARFDVDELLYEAVLEKEAD